jgi:conjugal transfer mating pair stabilization protein TraG
MFVAVFFVCMLVYNVYIKDKRLSVDPTTYTPLLQLIAHAESSGNYNAYFGHGNNTSIDFTSMSIAQVMAWQADYVKQGSPSNAVGKYQIISSTLSGLVRQLGINKNQRFDQATQDKMAIALIERRGAVAYVNHELTRDQFAANLAKEWASLPKVVGDDPNSSYYASDGLNKSRVSINQIMQAIEPIKAK